MGTVKEDERMKLIPQTAPWCPIYFPVYKEIRVSLVEDILHVVAYVYLFSFKKTKLNHVSVNMPLLH